MASVTYFVALPFVRGEDGSLIAGEAVECQSSGSAVRTAARLALTAVSAVAFSRTGDPSTGDFEDAQIIKAFGEPVSRDALLSGP